MKLSKRRRSRMFAMDMTPMIDVVFLLLIFFMIINQVSEANREELELPKLRGAADQLQGPLVINVDADERIVVSGRELDRSALAVLVGGEIAKLDGDASRLQVTLRGDQRVRAGAVNRVVEQLEQLGVQQVRIAVQVEGG